MKTCTICAFLAISALALLTGCANQTPAQQAAIQAELQQAADLNKAVAATNADIVKGVAATGVLPADKAAAAVLVTGAAAGAAAVIDAHVTAQTAAQAGPQTLQQRDEQDKAHAVAILQQMDATQSGK